ncbi:hypothetical protein CHS0354_026722 [Potamilus streckersoni]|uniref:Sodefrin-like factor n=1 Tax=Potamilus streckersoni TaxID=2493646 RepID=A0AAE0S7T5_9BIVA|nr:hypothetical protein CHS0354_026722 [Potamilus streckersoni]
MAQELQICGLVLLGVLLSVEIQGTNALTCRVCRNALFLDECTEQQTCLYNEECYIDQLLTPQFQILYNAGCRSKAVCLTSSTTHVGKRALSNYIGCSQCCDTHGNSSNLECNIHLCGIRNRYNTTIQCYYCGGDGIQGAVFNGRKCERVQTCNEDEVCFASTKTIGGSIMHSFGCAQKLHCQVHTTLVLEGLGISTGIDISHLTATGEIAFVGRKRQTEVCYICCGDALCNNSECWEVKNRIAAFAKARKLDYATLTLKL